MLPRVTTHTPRDSFESTHSSPLKIGHPKRKFMFQPAIFRCCVSFRDGTTPEKIGKVGALRNLVGAIMIFTCTEYIHLISFIYPVIICQIYYMTYDICIMYSYTLLGTSISRQNATLKMIFLFQWWFPVGCIVLVSGNVPFVVLILKANRGQWDLEAALRQHDLQNQRLDSE